MTLHITLRPELEGFVQSQIASGAYGSADEMIGAALTGMKTHKEKMQAFARAVEEGEKSGEGIPYTSSFFPDLMNEVRSLPHDYVVNPDVLP